MDFVYHLTVPADRAASDPAELVADIGVGVITEVTIEIPRGCKGMVYAAVRQGNHQAYPLNPEGAYHSDGRIYRAREHYPVRRNAPLFVCQGWSPGTTYDHTVEFKFTMLPVEIAEPWRHQESVMDVLLRGLGLKKASKKG